MVATPPPTNTSRSPAAARACSSAASIPSVTHGRLGAAPPVVTCELSVRAQLLDEGGPELWSDFMDELRAIHLGAPPKPGRRNVG